MLEAKSLPRFLWAEAVNTAVFLLNRTATSQVPNATPYEIWHGIKPDLSHVRVFGSDAFTHIPKMHRRKLDPKAEKVILVEFSGDSQNYKLYNPRSKKIVVSRDVMFNEKVTTSVKKSNTANV